MNIVYNLVDRAILLSDKCFHYQNITRVKRILQENSYPLDFIEKHIKSRLAKIHFTQIFIIIAQNF